MFQMTCSLRVEVQVTVEIPNVLKEGRSRFSHMNVVYLDLLLYTQRMGSTPNSKRDSWLLGRFRRLKCGIVVSGFLCTIVTIRDVVITNLMYLVSLPIHLYLSEHNNVPSQLVDK